MEQQTEKLLPYQKLLRENNLQESDLDRGTQQMISDLKKTLNMLYAQSQRKGINIQVSENTQNKINTYDRHICNDILDYLDELEEQKEAQKEQEQKEEIKEEIKEELKEEVKEEAKEVNSSSENNSQTTNSQTTKQVTNDTESNDSEKSGRVGFWNWE
jgi:thiamine pyrophosphate-dependent acetolactate synthase large subunit-like protein